MPLIELIIPTDRENFEVESWTQNECYRFYVENRRRFCNFCELLDLWLRAPYCKNCALSDPIYQTRLPDVSPETWIDDVAWSLGEDRLRAIQQELRADSGYALCCKGCGEQLRPWSHHDLWVVTYHLEEHYGIPTEAKGKKPSKKLQETILALYGRTCFGCGLPTILHLDHILPRSRGGTAAFRNLQPLCDKCGQIKADTLPETIEVFSDMYFESPPSEAYEGLFGRE